MYVSRNHNAWLEVTSRDAIDYVTLRHIFTSLVISNTNFVDWSNTDYTPKENGPPDQLSTFKEGFQELAFRMARRFVRKRK